MDNYEAPLFSVITPIFNKITAIEEGLNVIKNQSFKDYELILIDDGSTDSSSEYCDNIPVIDTKIKVIHQKNWGSGFARNRGIEHAKGEYICFFDIDDKVKADWLEKIHELIITKNPDVLIYSYKEINPKLKTSTTFKFQDKSYISNKEIKSDFVENLSGIKFNNGFVWNKVYKREFLIRNNITFHDLRIQQDEVFNHDVYKNANSLITASEVLYDYYIYEKGNTRNSFIPDRLKIFEGVKESFLNLSDYWHLDNSDLHYYIHSRFARNSLFNRNPKNTEKISEFRNILFQNESLNESVLYLLKSPKLLSIREKLYLEAIIKKSAAIFLLAEIYSHFCYLGGKIYHKFLR